MESSFHNDPFAPLSDAEKVGGQRTSQGDGWEPIIPIPDDAPSLTKEFIQARLPHGFHVTAGWKYLDAAGRRLCSVVRADRPANGSPAAKMFMPFCFCESSHGKREWRAKGLPAPRPLYHLDHLAARPNDPVLIVEGEKTADAAASLFPGYVVITSPSGSKSAAKADWSPLRGRRATIWPDNDEPGRAYAAEVDELVRLSGAQSVANVATVAASQALPEGWDLADDLPQGMDRSELISMLEGAARSENGPLPLFPPLTPAEPYPVDYLGPFLSSAAGAIARKVQVPMATAAQSVLAVAALAAQAYADVKLPYGQTRPLSLSFVTIAGSGDRKSSADNEALWPVRKREKTLKEEHETAMQGWWLEHSAWTAEKNKITNSNKLDHHQRKEALRDLGGEPERPLHPMLTLPDPTVEGLAKAWVNAPASLGVFTAEGGMFVGGHGMSDEAKLRTAAAYSELWDGRPLKRVRALDGVTLLYGRRLSMHVMVQPSAAAVFLADGTLRDQGLLSRMLVAAPNSIAGTRAYRDTNPLDDAAIRTYGARILSLLEGEWPLVEGKRNELEPRELPMAAGAAALWKTFFDHVEGRMGKRGELAAIPDFAAKAAEHAARIAAVIQIVEKPQSAEVTEAAMECGVSLADWYVGEALRLQQAARTDGRLLRAAELLEWMQGRDAESISFRDILRLGPSAVRIKETAENAIDILIKHGWVAEISKRPRSFSVMSQEAA